MVYGEGRVDKDYQVGAGHIPRDEKVSAQNLLRRRYNARRRLDPV